MKKLLLVIAVALAMIVFTSSAYARVNTNTETQTIYASEDAQTYTGLPDNNLDNYDSLLTDELWTGKFAENLNTRSYLKFDLPNLSQVTSAYLYLYNGVNADVYPAFPWGTSDVTAYQVANSWSAGTITWNNQPDFDATGGTTSVGTTLGYYAWDVTNLLQGAGAGAFSLALASDGVAHVYYGDGNHIGLDVAPYLQVTTVAPEPVSSALFLMGGLALAGTRLRRNRKNRA